MRKEEILKEILRTAKENNGVPLGKKRFYTETGVKESDWSGKYWVRWSDAIKEAGLKSNKMQQAYQTEFLLEEYAKLIRTLRHIPTSPELRMRARQDSNFPSHTTFSRLAPKQQLIQMVHEYCENNEEYSDVIQITKRKLINTSVTDSDPESRPDHIGYVYLIKFGNEYKIGNSNNVERRFRELKTQMPYEGKIIHTISTGDPEGIESYWHKYFEDKRLKGEWFRLSLSDIRYFKKRKLM